MEAYTPNGISNAAHSARLCDPSGSATNSVAADYNVVDAMNVHLVGKVRGT